MFSSRLLLSLVFVPAFVSAAIFPPDSLVKMLDAKGFKKAMKANVGVSYSRRRPYAELASQQTSLVAFVAPWCGV
jgi:protein disulfide-isomerase A6